MKPFLALLVTALLLDGCAHVTIPDTEACAVRGNMSKGAKCSHTIIPDQREMDLNEFIKWLEPDVENKRGAAICQSSEDWTKIKSALQKACYLLKKRCSYEMKFVIASMDNTIQNLSGIGTENENPL